MAKIELTREKTEHFPPTTETIEVRAWALGGTFEQTFYIGSGYNAQASSNIWLEIIYSVEGAQLFYSRNLLHLFYPNGEENPTPDLEEKLDDVVKNGGVFALCDIMPATSLTFTNQEDSYPSKALKISADTGAVFGRTAPEGRSIDIVLNLVGEEDKGERFMREIIQEIRAVQMGKHPDPASFPRGSSEWPFALQLNRLAYDKISAGYQDNLFANLLLSDSFDGWLAQLPPGGQLLDAGCGHGEPVIARLLEKGFQVTGSDFSPEMLRRAARQFPQVTFLHQPITALDQENTYDGVCSFNSMLYLDPIDLLNSIYRLHCALKPGGLLFLYGFDSGPDWRGEPYGHRLKHWMWSWHYGMEEVARLLEEHGYFEVRGMRKVQVSRNKRAFFVYSFNNLNISQEGCVP